MLEDNGRSPSGVSYVVENRHLMLRAFPDLMHGVRVRPVSDYGRQLLEQLSEVAPPGVDDPRRWCCSRPACSTRPISSTSFLAREMGVPLVEGRDLVVENDRVFMRTIAGLVRRWT